MNETSVNPVGSVRAPETGTQAKVIVPNKTETATVRENTYSDSDRSTKQVGHEADHAKKGSNISIHFKVDDESKRLTVFVVDKESRRVIRSIPASELSKLQAGDLLKLTA